MLLIRGRGNGMGHELDEDWRQAFYTIIGCSWLPFAIQPTNVCRRIGHGDWQRDHGHGWPGDETAVPL